VYALGVIWYQLLIGDLQAGAPTGLHWAEELRLRDAPHEMIYLLADCISDREEQRPCDAADLAERLKLITQSPPPPPPPPRRKSRSIRPREIVWSDSPHEPIAVSFWVEVFQKTLERAVREGHNIHDLPVKFGTHADQFRGSVSIKTPGQTMYVDSHASAIELRRRTSNVLQAMGKLRKFMLIECDDGSRKELPE
jgi:hypothetical protein